MKISICIPQYNRINFLLKSLEIIAKQDYDNIEIVISDDCSPDDTAEKITELQKNYRYPIIFSRNEPNLGYDRNLRKSLELATGDYLFTLGNDDSLFFKEAISNLVRFLKENEYPAVGFCNFVEFIDKKQVIKRAVETKVFENGEKAAIQNYSNFTFVGGLIFKREWFEKVNTDEFDGSIFVQVYLILRIILGGGKLFSIYEPLVVKDIQLEGETIRSYKNKLQHKWKDFKPLNGGLYGIGDTIISAFKDSGSKFNITFYYLRRMYFYTYPHWILDYKSNNALVSSIGLVVGLNPLKNPYMNKINFFQRLFIYLIYVNSTVLALLIPTFIYNKSQNLIYNLKKRFLK